MDQFAAHTLPGRPQATNPEGLQAPQGLTQAQILAAIEASSMAVQAKIQVIALNLHLLRTDVCKVAERTVTMKRHVCELQMEMQTLKATVTALEAVMRKPELFPEEWIRAQFPDIGPNLLCSNKLTDRCPSPSPPSRGGTTPSVTGKYSKDHRCKVTLL
ncbi:hypothetical protein NDU88_003391 [Pleurodeles waltl]|uniref:Uncharacterized protein n=1 Tax=Pleurodeles waltl TaxID=8319 RepID=A0AAV7KVG0_PLEWA|nr:hypothetical protein NDU88_003391 [Pleurodeles waltl]